MKELLDELKKHNLVSTSCSDILEQNFEGVSLELLNRINLSKASKGKGIKFSPELRSFALTLQFYSSKAYGFVRKSFQFALPHPSQVRRWYSYVQAEPGFTKPAFQALKAKIEFPIER